MKIKPKRALPFLACASVAGCMPAEDESTPPVSPAWTLVEELQYAPGEDAPLSGIQTVTVGEDGRLYAVDSNTLGVLVFGSDGAYQRTIGREGEGPGEFLSVGRPGVRGDTVWVVDARLGRITMFGHQGEVIGTWANLGLVDFPGPEARRSIFARLAEGSLLLGSIHTDPGGGSARLDYARLPLDSEAATALPIFNANLASRWFVVLPAGETGTTGFRQPFDHYRQVGLPALGDRIVVLDRPEPAPGGPAAARLSVLEPDGSARVVTDITYTPVPLDASLVERWLDWYMTTDWPRASVEIGLFASPEAVREAARSALTVPAYVPPTSNFGTGIGDRAILAAADGTIWLQGWYEPGASARTWLVLSSEGARLGRATIPSTIRLLEVRGDRAWGVIRDVFNVPTIVRYRVQR